MAIFTGYMPPQCEILEGTYQPSSKHRTPVFQICHPTSVSTCVISTKIITPGVVKLNYNSDIETSLNLPRNFRSGLFGVCYQWPVSIDAGLNLQDTAFYVQVWNGNETSTVSINSVAVPEGSGILIDTLLPIKLRPYDGAMIKLIVQGREGIPRVSDYISIIISNAQTLKTGISITRAAIVSIPIDWQDGVTEKIEYLTNIITSYDETEQRIQIRTNPRKSLVYTYTLSGPDEIGILDSLIWNWQGTVYMIPDWLRQSKLSPVTYGDFIVTSLEPAIFAISPGDSFAIIKNSIDYEVLTCQSVDGNKITTSTMAMKSWDATCTIVPLVRARITDQIDISRPTGEIAKAVISFEVEAVE